MDEALKKKAEALLASQTYLDMNEEDLAVVVEYETENYKPKVYELFREGKTADEITDVIHEWWSDYRIADGTEDKLCEYVEELGLNGQKNISFSAANEKHEREMINSYAFFMDKYFNENKGFHFPTNIIEHDDVRYVLEHEGHKITIEFDPSWSQLVYTVNGKGPFAHTSYEHIWDDIRDVLAFEAQELNKNAQSLASRLNEFYKDFDFYDYMDSFDGAQTEEDLVEGLVEQLADAKAVDGILVFLKDIKENGEPDGEQSKVLDSLIEEVVVLQENLGVSLEDKLAEAVERSEQQGVEPGKCRVDILQIKLNDDTYGIRGLDLSHFENGVDDINYDNYENVYSYLADRTVSFDKPADVNDLLDFVYVQFHDLPPEDFKASRLNISDVVVLTQGNECRAYFCEARGFKELPEAFVDRVIANAKENFGSVVSNKKMGDLEL